MVNLESQSESVFKQAVYVPMMPHLQPAFPKGTVTASLFPQFSREATSELLRMCAALLQASGTGGHCYCCLADRGDISKESQVVWLVKSNWKGLCQGRPL